MVVFTVNEVAYSLQLPVVYETGSTISCQYHKNKGKWRILVTHNKDKNDEFNVCVIVSLASCSIQEVTCSEQGDLYTKTQK